MAPYPAPTAQQIAAFRQHGWVAIPSALPGQLIERLRAHCDRITGDLGRYAYEAIGFGRTPPPPPGGDEVWMSMLTHVWADWAQHDYHRWTAACMDTLVGAEMELWYDQLILKPPRNGAATYWHRDEVFVVPGVPQTIVSCWFALEDVDDANGAMTFLNGGHKDHGLLADSPVPTADHVGDPHCSVDERLAQACPMRAGDVSFHFGKTPHMTPANRSDAWRRAVIQRFKRVGAEIPTHHG